MAVLTVYGSPTPSEAASWPVHTNTQTDGLAEASTSPTVPAMVTASCTSTLGNTISLSWAPSTDAATYTIYESETSATDGFTQIANGIVGSDWTSPALEVGDYWFEVSAAVGVNWRSAPSSSSGESTMALVACLQP